MIKLSRKELKELGEILNNSFYCGGNVYNHENITYYITHKEISKIDTYNSNLFMYLDNTLTEYLKDTNTNYYIISNQIAYSCGTYGNTGQIVKYNIVNEKTHDIIDTFYTYYC